jgi:hypothetical protein
MFMEERKLRSLSSPRAEGSSSPTSTCSFRTAENRTTPITSWHPGVESALLPLNPTGLLAAKSDMTVWIDAHRSGPPVAFA